MSDSDETTYNPYSFDKNGDAYQAAKFRETLTIKEFAEFLADCDSRQIGEYDTEGWVFLSEKSRSVGKGIIRSSKDGNH